MQYRLAIIGVKPVSNTGYHARLSPSGAHRWVPCPGSVVLESAYPDTSSHYADEGTAAHTLAAMCLESPGRDAAGYIGEALSVGASQFAVTRDMAKHVQAYVDYVRERARGKTLYVEQKVPIGHITGELGATGTVDAAVIDAATRRIEIIDLKYGAGVAVRAEGNEQGQMYALGALEEWSLIAAFDSVTITVFQPRIAEEPDSWTISVSELGAFADMAAASAQTAAEAERAVGWLEEAAWGEAYLSAGEKQCRFCRVPKHKCPAYFSEMTELLGAPATAKDFAEFVAAPIGPETSDNWLPVLMAKLPMLEGFCKSIRAEAERRLFAGEKVDGFKLVQGRQGPRKWADSVEAERVLIGLGLPEYVVYDKSLRSPTALEKSLKKLNPKEWEELQPLVSRSTGSISLALANDPRPEVSVTATAADFAGFVTSTTE